MIVLRFTFTFKANMTGCAFIAQSIDRSGIRDDGEDTITSALMNLSATIYDMREYLDRADGD